MVWQECLRSGFGLADAGAAFDCGDMSRSSRARTCPRTPNASYTTSTPGTSLAKRPYCLHDKDAMINRIGIVILAVVSVALGIVAYSVQKKATERHDEDVLSITSFSNKLTVASEKYDEQQRVNSTLEKQVADEKAEILTLTNNITKVSGDLLKSEDALHASQDALHASQEEVKKDEAKIADLESQNQALDKKALDLTNSISTLTVQIADTQRKLASSEGDKADLESQLKRLMAEKKELERQFNDLTVLRAQVAKLKEEINTQRRIEWSKQGLFAGIEEKGAQKLMTGRPGSAAAKAPRPAYDLNVEINSDGSVKVIPSATNAPASPK
jgi:septal ring factor EnvC (AmiA/AmiB activator)